MCAETEKQKEKGYGVRSMDVNRYAIPIPNLSLTSQNQPTAGEIAAILLQVTMFAPDREGTQISGSTDNEREAEEVDRL